MVLNEFDEKCISISGLRNGLGTHLSSPGADNVFLVSVQGISNTRVISDFHSKSPDLVIIIIDLSKVTVPDE